MIDVGTTGRYFKTYSDLDHPTDPIATSLSDRNLYRMWGLTCLPVCILDMFLAPALISRLVDIPQIPKTISLPMIVRAPSTANFTRRRDYPTKLRDYFSIKPDEPLRRKIFLLCGMECIGKTQICLEFTEENSDL
jgi:hypothetical protein